MIRLKETINPKELEKYNFEERLVREWNYKTHSPYYRSVYEYSFYKHSDNSDYVNFQSVSVYIQPWLNAYGKVIREAREVEANQHAFKCDKAVDLIVKLVIAGIFEYIEDKEPKQ